MMKLFGTKKMLKHIIKKIELLFELYEKPVVKFEVVVDDAPPIHLTIPSDILRLTFDHKVMIIMHITQVADLQYKCVMIHEDVSSPDHWSKVSSPPSDSPSST